MFRFVGRLITLPFRLVCTVVKTILGFAGAALARKVAGVAYEKVTGDAPPKPKKQTPGFPTGKAMAFAAGAGALAGLGRMAARSVLASDDG